MLRRYNAPNKHIVSFGAAIRKRNRRSLLAVIFIRTFKENDTMWAENTKNGKVRFVERYMEPLTGQYRKVSVVMDKNTAAVRKQATEILQTRIEDAIATTAAYTKQDNLTLQELVDLYRDSQKSSVSASTYQRNFFATQSILKLLGPSTLVNQLSAGYVKTQFIKNHDAPGTINERITRFKALIRWGYDNDYISDINYLKKIKPLPDKEAREKLDHKFLEKSELSTLLDAMRVKHWHYLTALMVLSGLRVGEALALTMNDIDFANKVIHITKTYDAVNQTVTTPKTPTSNRDVFMQPELEDLLHEICNDTSKRKNLCGFRGNLLLCNKNGQYLRYYAFNKYLKETSSSVLGRPITTHVLRHTHVSLLAEAGVPLETITRRVGHEDSDITKRVYLHVTNRMIERDNEIVSKISLL